MFSASCSGNACKELDDALIDVKIAALPHLCASPMTSGETAWALSDKLSDCLKELIIGCPDLGAVSRALEGSVKALLASSPLKKLLDSAVHRAVAQDATAHNEGKQPPSRTLASLPPDVLECILRQVPISTLPFTQKGYASLAHSSLACKATWSAYNRFAAHFKLEWRIEKFGSVVSADALFSPTAGEIVCLGRRWSVVAYPKGKGDGAGTHVSTFLRGTPLNDGESGIVTCAEKVEMLVGEKVCFSSSSEKPDFPNSTFTRGYFKPVAYSLVSIGATPADITIRWWVHGAKFE